MFIRKLIGDENMHKELSTLQGFVVTLMMVSPMFITLFKNRPTEKDVIFIHGYYFGIIIFFLVCEFLGV